MNAALFRATGEAMPIAVDDNTLEASADLLALLAVCTFTAERIAKGDIDATSLTSDLARCLNWACSLASQTHGDIDTLARIARQVRT